MTWLLWSFLLGMTTAASVAAVSAYLAWSIRYRHAWIGTVTEIALAAAIIFAIGAGFTALADHMP